MPVFRDGFFYWVLFPLWYHFVLNLGGGSDTSPCGRPVSIPDGVVCGPPSSTFSWSGPGLQASRVTVASVPSKVKETDLPARKDAVGRTVLWRHCPYGEEQFFPPASCDYLRAIKGTSSRDDRCGAKNDIDRPFSATGWFWSF